jgi:hypothetical protein
MLINIKDIPPDIIDKIPLSIILNIKDDIIDTDKLPFKVAYESRNCIADDTNIPIVFGSSIDITPEFSIYNDFKNIKSKALAVTEYVRSLFNINKGSYPFDPTFGTDIKKYINTKETTVRNMIIENELRNIADGLSYSFDIPIKLNRINISNVENNASITYNMEIEMNVGGVNTNFKVSYYF